MYKKLRNILIILFVIGLIIAITLILLSLARIEVGYVGLCYDKIVSNYSSTDVYTPGLYFIGIARSFIRFKQIPTTIQLDLRTYTADYYKMDVKIIGSYQFTNPTNFASLSKFYMNLGESPQVIIQSVMQKKIIQILSLYTSIEYQNDLELQSTISNTIDITLLEQLQADLDINILIESIVIEGMVFSNLQEINRKIDDSERILARRQREKIDMSRWVQNHQRKSQNQVQIVKGIINQRANIVQRLISTYSTQYSKISEILLGNQIVSNYPSYTSSTLMLRPELYAINNQTIY